MKRKNVTRTLIITNGIEVTKVDESFSSLDRINEIAPFAKIRINPIEKK
jgi:hypothetical protein